MRSLLLAACTSMAFSQVRIALELMPGVTTTLKRNPAGLRKSFAVTASAGQTLPVELNLANPLDAIIRDHKIQVHGRGGAEVETGWEPTLPTTG